MRIGIVGAEGGVATAAGARVSRGAAACDVEGIRGVHADRR